MTTDSNAASIDSYLQVLSPLTPIFSYNQLETLLCAWVPNRLDGVLERHGLKSGLYVVDHFVVTATIALLLVSTKILVTYVKHQISRRSIPKEQGTQSISVTIHPSITDSYHNIPNVFHQSLAYLISEKTKSWTSGSFSLQALLDIGHDENNPPIFNVVPDLNQGKLIFFIFILFYFFLSFPPPYRLPNCVLGVYPLCYYVECVD
ncbi:hypothetical protein BGW37DRAFT_44067 [Umbelopsis sp. PMI_123]|nr:hypothetical protein BGW37DRAFT_44067 [Umbelopsis sp. PMI_123]